MPAASILNYHTNQGLVANGAVVELSNRPDDLSVLAGVSSTHLIVDVFGCFQ